MAKRSAATYDPTQNFAIRTFDVEYRRDGAASWLARIYQPQGEGPFPALLYVHGGAWSRGDRTNNASELQLLAASGLVVVAVDLRLAPRYPYPAQVADVNCATRWLKVHASKFNADPKWVGGLGSSSGGHTVMLSAMRPYDPRYLALPVEEAGDADARLAYIIALWPIMDSYARYLFVQETSRPELVKATEGYFLTKETMQEGNPQRILDRGEKVELPRTLIIQGTADANIPIALTQCFATAYRAAGGVIELEQFPDMQHAFAGWPEWEVSRALSLMKAFVAR